MGSKGDVRASANTSLCLSQALSAPDAYMLEDTWVRSGDDSLIA